ncbi:MAG: hypothetical protein FJ086_13890 [Deltaproteobacteria bacterium]|nr:hypothetical protein [Deltaproteobacteria bacterium]
MGKVHLVTLTRLNRCLSRVRGELAPHGPWTPAAARVEGQFVGFGGAYGWK